MKKVATVLGSAVLGLSVCAAFVWISNMQGVSVRFPSPGGEDDFSQRAAYFLFGVCPAFLFLGALIGYMGLGSARQWLAMWGGVLLGSVTVWGCALLMRTQIDQLSGDGTANFAVLVFYCLWIISSCIGVAIAWRLLSR